MSQENLFDQEPDANASTSLAEGSRARMSASLESALESLVNALDYGAKCSESSPNYSPFGFLPRTYPVSYQGTLDGGLSRSFTKWPKRAITSGGASTERTMWVHHTAEKGFSSSGEDWRTPSASDTEGGVMEMRAGADAKYKLRDHAANWPTAGANDWKGTAKPGQRRDQLDEAAEQTFPHDRVNSTDGENSCEADPTSRPHSPKKMRLNYRFTERLMGFPESWL